MILVDTSVWSLAMRRRPEQLNPVESRIVAEWSRLALEGEVVLIDPVRQEVLSGIRHQAQFDSLQKQLENFPCLKLDHSHYVHASKCFNTCRAHGISAGAIDMIICAAAIDHAVHILSVDPNFGRYAKHLPIDLVPLP